MDYRPVYKVHIRSRKSLFDFDWNELVEYKDLLWMLIHRELIAVYKQSVLGPLWFVLQPLATTVVFTVIFGNFAKISTDGTPPFLFYMAGTILWNYFSNCMNSVSSSLIANSTVFSKVYFPRLVVPVSIVVSNMAQFLMNFLLFLIFYLYFYFFSGADVNPNSFVFTVPLLVLHAAVVGLGMGLWLAACTVKYRDLRFALPFLAQLWMYVTPVVYPLSMVPDKWKWLLALNPMAAIVELNRIAFLGAGSIDVFTVVSSVVVGLLLLVSGVLIFNKSQRTFVDTI